jgi:hypothetical protein
MYPPRPWLGDARTGIPALVVISPGEPLKSYQKSKATTSGGAASLDVPFSVMHAGISAKKSVAFLEALKVVTYFMSR